MIQALSRRPSHIARPTSGTMAPHLTPLELDQLMSWKGNKATNDMYTELATSRRAQGIAPVCISAIRKALRGVTHRRGRSETRGRKRRVSNRGVEALDQNHTVTAFMPTSCVYIRLLSSRPRRCSTYVRQLLRTARGSDRMHDAFCCH